MKDTNYINIQGWMINQLNLSGNKLIVYAIIYGFSQDGVSKYSGSSSYLAECTGISKQAVLEILRVLTEDGLIIKEVKTQNGQKFCDYYAVPGQETLPPPVKKLDHPRSRNLTTPGQETLPPPVKKLDPILNIINKRDKETDKESDSVSFDSNKHFEPCLSDGNSPDDIPTKTKEDAIMVWNKAREFWNERNLKPCCRDLMMRPADTPEILQTFQVYSWNEIRNAIGNYAWHKFKAGSEYRPPPPYGSLTGFLKTGVEKYHDDDALDQQFKESK
jgi:DNA-binding HxlR family transcriptional regulator